MPSLWADSLDEHRALVLGRLLDAYGDLHAEHGLEATTLSAVAERSGIARSAIYNYFGDKHDLAVAHAERTMATVAADLRAEVLAHDRAPARIRAYLSATLRAHATVPGSGDDLMPLLTPEQQGRVLAALAPVRTLLEDTVAMGLADGDLAGDADSLVLLVWSTIAGLRMPVAAGHLDPEQTAAKVADILLDGMRPR